MSDQQDRVETFLASIGSKPADASTACTDWTAHNIAAHLAAGFEEVYVLIQNTLAGQPTRDTRTFVEREAPFLEMDHETLLQSLREHLTKTAEVLTDFRAAGPDAVFEFFGHPFTAEEMTRHLDSELAIHRWDFMGDDEISEQQLSNPAFTRHAVFLLNALPMLAEGAPNRVAGTGLRAITIVLRTPGEPDVALEVDADGEAARYTQGESEGSLDGQFVVTTDAANRVLALWGRHSSRKAVSVTGDPALWGAVANALWPDAHKWPKI
ncbi:maleylpyruvate isomerase N-terminal domain-containing protein [Mycobacterium sp. AT1]|uniref:maleylpyruvate isomerase N-terminal domain-containing protein n=1 Tax=Mycobacterium sp. AT1 TaxID=1961706 RepID=UPI0009AC2978|nr:maleylpyruvate isomerase N-terminal domain-containing protein [Mycobacterium sp. AT1]OPX05574.1 hypothetical protein B1790_31520 [Mycobacterium sp. AT1]